MELNRSRLAALEELKTARLRISDLEQQLAAAQAQLEEARKGPAPQLATPAANLSTNQQATSANAPLSSPASQPPCITVAYETGWGLVYLHYNVDGQGWTKSPGIPMQEGREDLAGKKVLEVRGHRLEFVLNDGAGDWDTPDPSGGGRRNYVIDSPGRYRLKSGQLHRV
ncbi:hypothetical protein WJX72_004677 [[Myrmecia] bisecta]|uniref:Carbohydrate binding module family 25 domain-containing protein n=1 Tax=[Myrmecia] bisecta TaxID=41462 RepID=A0AAW1P8K0_9CHLO